MRKSKIKKRGGKGRGRKRGGGERDSGNGKRGGRVKIAG